MVPNEESRARAHPERQASEKDAPQHGGLLGLGLDGSDGHKRITRGEDFFLFGGSQQTHERMRDIVLRMRERLRRKGKTFAEISPSEFEDLGRDCVR